MLDSEVLENLDIKIRIGTLLFDVFLDSSLVKTDKIIYAQKHNHSSYEIHFIVAGKGKLMIGNKEVDLFPNNVFIIGPEIYHSIWQDDQNPLLKYNIRFTYSTTRDSDSFFPENEVSWIKEALSDIRFVYLSDTQNIISLLQNILSELDNKEIGYYAKIQSLFIQILMNLLCATNNHKKIYIFPQKSRDDQRSVLIETFFDDYRNDLRIDQLADLLNLSSKQVNRIIKKLYNTTFKQKLIDMRMEVAKDLLRDNALTIESVAEEVGYASQNNFYVAFKQHTGLSPSEYREKVCDKRK
ncbi:MAG TPA: hypothetical protein DDZ89_14310 [Clostridiales bacterium]|nr:hypothetical protein [Clostridiales bacterium]